MITNSVATDRLTRLEQLVPLCGSIRKGTEYATALAQATSEVQKAEALPDRLANLEPVLRVLAKTTHFSANEIAPDLDKIIGAGRELERCVNAETLRDARFGVQAAQEAIQRIEKVVVKAWTARVRAEFVPLQSLGAVLASIPDTKKAGQELQGRANEALVAAGNGVPSSSILQAFDQARADLSQRLQLLNKLGIDESVRTFLLELAGGDATLSNLTPDVLEWLQARSALARFRIQLR